MYICIKTAGAQGAHRGKEGKQMKKLTKRLVSLVLGSAVCLSLCVPAFAEEQQTQDSDTPTVPMVMQPNTVVIYDDVLQPHFIQGGYADTKDRERASTRSVDEIPYPHIVPIPEDASESEREQIQAENEGAIAIYEALISGNVSRAPDPKICAGIKVDYGPDGRINNIYYRNPAEPSGYSLHDPNYIPPDYNPPTEGAGALSKEGEVAYNQVNLSVFGKLKAAAGQNYRLSNGLEIPSTINYTSEAGGGTIYVPIRMIAELLNANLTWDNQTKTADFAGFGGPVKASISSGTEAAPADEIPEKPSYGQKAGAFEEIDPSTVSMRENIEEQIPLNYLKNTRIQYEADSNFPEYTLKVRPEQGDYIIFTVTNNSQEPRYTSVLHQNPLDASHAEPFSRVPVNPGETLVRVFHAGKDANPMDYTLCFDVGKDLDLRASTDVTVSLKQCFFE